MSYEVGALVNDLVRYDKTTGVPADLRLEGPAERPVVEELSIVELLWRRRGTMTLCVLAALALGVAYLAVAPRKYTSSASLLVSAAEGRASLPGVPSGPFADANAKAHAELLESDTVLIAALADPRVATSRTLEGAQDPIERLRKQIVVKAGEEERIVTVSLSAEDPEEAAVIVNRVVAAYLENQRQQRHTANAAMLRRLEHDVAQILDTPDAEAPLPLANAALVGGDDPQLIAERLQELDQRLTQTELAAAEARALVETSRSLRTSAELQQLLLQAGIDTSREVVGPQHALLTALAAVEQERHRLGRLGPQHPIAAGLDEQAASLRQQIADWETANTAALRLRLQEHARSLERREASVREALAQQHRLAASLETLPVALIDPARPAERPSSPKASRVVAVSLVLGVLGGTLLVFWLDFREHASAVRAVMPRSVIEQPADLEVRTEMPLLGVIPETPKRAEGPETWDATASSIHHIRAMLQVRARNANQRTFAVTSSRRGSGKTSITTGLASSLAMSGTRTLVVDCDLASRVAQAQPTAAASRQLDNLMQRHGYLLEGPNGHATSGTFGVAAMLDGRTLEDALVPSSVANLDVLPAGPVQPDHIARLSDAFIRQLLQQANERYDIVLIDTGPVPGSVEALLVCSRTDGVLIVAPHGETRAQFDKTTAYLRMLGARLTGTIFNRLGGSGQPSADAGFIPRPRHREPNTGDNLGSGLLAAAVFGRKAEASPASDEDDADLKVTVNDLGDVVSALGERGVNGKNGSGQGLSVRVK